MKHYAEIARANKKFPSYKIRVEGESWNMTMITVTKKNGNQLAVCKLMDKERLYEEIMAVCAKAKGDKYEH